LVSSHGISAATAITVGTLTDRTQQLLSMLGLGYYPQAITLAEHAGARQLKIDLGGQVDLSSAATGTRYFVSNPDVIQYSPDGMVFAGNAGTAVITVINGPAERLIPVKVEAPQTGAILVGPDGAIAQGSDGSSVAVGPGVLQSATMVAITPLTSQSLPMALP